MYRQLAKKVCRTQRSRSLSRPMGKVHTKCEHPFRGHNVCHTTDSEEKKKISVFMATVDRYWEVRTSPFVRKRALTGVLPQEDLTVLSLAKNLLFPFLHRVDKRLP
jgi:hypothetical protein